MLRSFTVKNFASFRDEATLDLQATRERQHSETLMHFQRARWLPLTMIFGPNASGKSALVRAFKALRGLISVRQDTREPLTPHAFGEHAKLPCEFTIEYSVPVGGREKIARYHVAATNARVVKESLHQVLFDGSLDLVFERSNPQGYPASSVTFGEKYCGDDVLLSFGKTVYQSTSLLGVIGRDDRAPAFIQAAFRWFFDTLQIVEPDSQYIPLLGNLDSDSAFRGSISAVLSQSDTGIQSLFTQEVDLSRVPFTPKELMEIMEIVAGGRDVLASAYKERYLFTQKEDSPEEMTVRALKTLHAEGVTFDILEESDGTQRFIDLLPMLLDLQTPGVRRVYVVDELERSLHPALTRLLVERYLEGCSKDTHTQLIFTTHETELLDQELIRRDEVWLTEKVDGAGQASELVALSDYAPQELRKGMSLRDVYLSGRVGALPRKI
ncbi:AAA family ATPase [Actinotignum schaalii]|uniref:AAA family ATPase n=2 Tax=Actinomycetaceae TaxID=2049 RepID=UPI00237EC96D|nr:AAA family ATPase [Actinotignum schaalii]MDE1654585.1 AAA family ATPase [Actinotignum schaalii]